MTISGFARNKEFPGFQFALKIARWFSFVVGCVVLILHNFGPEVNCAKGSVPVDAFTRQQCAGEHYRTDKYYFLLQATFICVVQYAWYVTCRKFGNVDTLMAIFRELAAHQLHDYDVIKKKVQELDTLRNIVHDAFKAVLRGVQEDSLLKTLLRIHQYDRFMCYVYFIKTVALFIIVSVFSVLTAITINKYEFEFPCRISAQIRCVAPYAFLTYVIYIADMVVLVYLFFVVSGFLVWIVREMFRSTENFNNLYLALELWLSNTNLKRTIGVLSVREIYGSPVTSRTDNHMLVYEF